MVRNNGSAMGMRRRLVAVAVAVSALFGGSVVLAQPAAAANAWSTCISPYEKAWNATSGDVADLIFNIGFANCGAKLANAAWNAGDVDQYAHYYEVWRGHYAAASKVGGTIAIKAWKQLAKYGISKGLATL